MLRSTYVDTDYFGPSFLCSVHKHKPNMGRQIGIYLEIPIKAANIFENVHTHVILYEALKY